MKPALKTNRKASAATTTRSKNIYMVAKISTSSNKNSKITDMTNSYKSLIIKSALSSYDNGFYDEAIKEIRKFFLHEGKSYMQSSKVFLFLDLFLGFIEFKRKNYKAFFGYILNLIQKIDKSYTPSTANLHSNSNNAKFFEKIKHMIKKLIFGEFSYENKNSNVDLFSISNEKIELIDYNNNFNENNNKKQTSNKSNWENCNYLEIFDKLDIFNLDTFLEYTAKNHHFKMVLLLLTITLVINKESVISFSSSRLNYTNLLKLYKNNICKETDCSKLCYKYY